MSTSDFHVQILNVLYSREKNLTPETKEKKMWKPSTPCIVTAETQFLCLVPNLTQNE